MELLSFRKFKDSAQAVSSLTDIQEGNLPDDLRKFLKKNIISKEINETLLCYESKIANAIKSTLGIETDSSSQYLEVFRGIKSQLTNLLSGNYHLLFYLLYFFTLLLLCCLPFNLWYEYIYRYIYSQWCKHILKIHIYIQLEYMYMHLCIFGNYIKND